jgi:hypothetical protein
MSCGHVNGDSRKKGANPSPSKSCRSKGERRGRERQMRPKSGAGGGGRVVKHRLLVVANRLPVSATRTGTHSWSLELNAGGLVSALLGIKQIETRWIGWAGVNVPDEDGQLALAKALAEKVSSSSSCSFSFSNFCLLLRNFQEMAPY